MGVEEIIYSKSKLYVFTGPMGSGKTRTILNIVDQLDYTDRKYLMIKPSIDNRYDEIVSRCYTKSKKAINIFKENSKEVLNYVHKADVFIFDEVQFFDNSLINVIEELKSYNKLVIVSGLDTDFRGETFGIMGELMTKADYIKKQTGVCNVFDCQNPSSRTQRLKLEKSVYVPANYNDKIESIENLEEMPSEKYLGVCFHHHIVYDHPNKIFDKDIILDYKEDYKKRSNNISDKYL